MFKHSIIAVVALSMAGCASAPSSIKPTNVSSSAYSGLSCGQLSQQSTRINAAYKVAADKQSSTRRADTIGVLLIGLPTGSMSGKDNSAEIARLKGEQSALAKSKAAKGCK